MPALAVLVEHELFGDHLGLGVQIVETACVGQVFVAVADVLAAHHDAVGRGVDEPPHAGGLPGVHEVLGALDVDVEAALAVLLGDRRAAHQVDDGRGVDDGVHTLDRARHIGGVGDVADDGLQLGDARAAATAPGRRSRTCQAAFQQGGHQVGADEAGAPGHQDAAQIGAQCWVSHLTRVTETCSSFEGLRGRIVKVLALSTFLGPRPRPGCRPPSGGRRPGVLRTVWPAPRLFPRA